MKIEDLNYFIPTSQIDAKDFDIEKWRCENPMDYFKALSLILSSADSGQGLPSNITMEVTNQEILKIIRLYIPDTLYKFYSLTADNDLNKRKFATLRNKQIFMSDIKDFNDPFDGKAFFYNPEELKDIKLLTQHKGRFIDDFTVFHKGTALTENNTNCMPMWAHYSNNHQGFCVAYDMKNSSNLSLYACTFPIQYTNQRLDITSFMKKYVTMISLEIDRQMAYGKNKIEISDLSIIYMSVYLSNIKHSTWRYEKEFRCTMGANAKGMPYVDAMPKAIYIGINCFEDNKKELIAIAKQLSIPIYQMSFDELSENYTLKAILLC